MNSDEAPSPLSTRFGNRFQEHPENAHVILRAHGHVAKDGTCKVETKTAGSEVGLHPALGGDPSKQCAGDILLGSLVACAGVTLSQMATAMEIELRDAIVQAEGDLDFRGSLGLAEDVPIGLNQIRLHFGVDSDATEEQLAMMIRLTERYCVVAQTLNPLTTVTFERMKPAA